MGYARVSTDDQGTNPQLDELRAAGCEVIHEERASGADRTRPVLARLLAVIEQLEAKGAHFRSLRDPIDTTTPQGMFSLQVLGAVAQLERALIAERTKAGLRAAKARGRVGGNPGLRARDPDAIRRTRSARDAARLDAVLDGIDAWLPTTVRRMRPDQSWGDVVRVLNRDGAVTAGRSWTVERLRRTVRRLATEGIVEPGLLDRAPPLTGSDRLVRLVGGIAAPASAAARWSRTLGSSASGGCPSGQPSAGRGGSP